MFSPKALLKIIINTLIGIILVFIWLRFVDLKQIIAAISAVNLALLAPAFFFMLLSPVIRAWRLKIFLRPIKKLNLPDLIFLNGVAQILNFFIPIRAGEVAKGVYLNHHYGLSLGKSIVWIFLDRFVDLIVVLIGAAALLLVIPTALHITFIKIIIVITVISLGLTYLMVFQVKLAEKIVFFLMHLIPVRFIKIYIERVFNFFLEALVILKRPSAYLGKLIILTILAYGADAAIWYFTFLALSSPQEFTKMYLGQLLSALTYLIPAAPGYVGSAEASGLLILSGIFGLDTNLASAMTVLFHIISALFVIIFGLISIYSLKIDLGMIFQKILKRD